MLQPSVHFNTAKTFPVARKKLNITTHAHCHSINSSIVHLHISISVPSIARVLWRYAHALCHSIILVHLNFRRIGSSKDNARIYKSIIQTNFQSNTLLDLEDVSILHCFH